MSTGRRIVEVQVVPSFESFESLYFGAQMELEEVLGLLSMLIELIDRIGSPSGV